VPVPEIVSGELAGYKAFQHWGELVFPSASGTPLRNRNWRRDDVFDPVLGHASLHARSRSML
jgi:hypothetical protein